MAKKQMKKLTLANINKEHKRFMETKKIEVMDGHYIEVNNLFSPTKINRIAAQLIVNYRHLVNSAMDMPEWNIYIYTLMIKEFTSLDVPDDPEKQIELLGKLVDIGAFTKIVEAFPEEEVEKVMKELGRILIRISDQHELFKKAMGEFDPDNPEVVELFADFIGEDEFVTEEDLAKDKEEAEKAGKEIEEIKKKIKEREEKSNG